MRERGKEKKKKRQTERDAHIKAENNFKVAPMFSVRFFILPFV